MADFGEIAFAVAKFLFDVTVDLICFILAVIDVASIYRALPFFRQLSRECSQANFRKACVQNLGIILIDIPTFIAGGIVMGTLWRTIPCTVEMVKEAWDSDSDSIWCPEIRIAVWKHLGALIVDIFSLVPAVLVLVCPWRVVPFFCHVKKNWSSDTGCYWWPVWKQFGILLGDIFCITPALLCLVATVWRLPRLVVRIKETYKWSSDGTYYQPILEQFGALCLDVPTFLFAGTLVFCTIWRVPSLILALCVDPYSYRRALWIEFFCIFADIAAFLCATFVVLTIWRLPALIRDLKSHVRFTRSQYGTYWGAIFHNAGQLLLDIPCLVLLALMLPTAYRVVAVVQARRARGDHSHDNRADREEIGLQFMLLILDFFFALATLLVLCTLVRSCRLVRLIGRSWREESGPWYRKMRYLALPFQEFGNFLLDLPIIVLLLILTATVYRLVLLILEARRFLKARAAPVPAPPAPGDDQPPALPVAAPDTASVSWNLHGRLLVLKHTALLLLDLVFVPFALVLALTGYRGYAAVREFRAYNQARRDAHQEFSEVRPRLIVVKHFFLLFVDLPFVLVGACVTATLWRAYPMWVEICTVNTDHSQTCKLTGAGPRYIAVLRHFVWTLIDLPALALFVFLNVTLIRAFLLYKSLITAAKRPRHTLWTVFSGQVWINFGQFWIDLFAILAFVLVHLVPPKAISVWQVVLGTAEQQQARRNLKDLLVIKLYMDTAGEVFLAAQQQAASMLKAGEPTSAIRAATDPSATYSNSRLLDTFRRRERLVDDAVRTLRTTNMEEVAHFGEELRALDKRRYQVFMDQIAASNALLCPLRREANEDRPAGVLPPGLFERSISHTPFVEASRDRYAFYQGLLDGMARRRAELAQHIRAVRAARTPGSPGIHRRPCVIVRIFVALPLTHPAPRPDPFFPQATKEQKALVHKCSGLAGIKEREWAQTRRYFFEALPGGALPAILAAIVLVGTIYRIPALILNLHRRPEERLAVCKEQCVEVFRDLFYLIAALLFMVSLYNTPAFLGDVLDALLIRRSVAESRAVVRRYYAKMGRDLKSFLSIFGLCSTYGYMMLTAVCSFFTPLELLAEAFQGFVRSKCIRQMLSFLCTLLFYVFPFVWIFAITPNSTEAGNTASVFAFLMVAVLVATVPFWSSFCSPAKWAIPNPSRAVQLSWHNVLMLIYLCYELLQLCFLYHLPGIHPSSQALLVEWPRQLARAVLLQFQPASGSLGFSSGFTVFASLAALTYLVITIPCVMELLLPAPESDHAIKARPVGTYSATPWFRTLTFLLGRVFFVPIVTGLAQQLVCVTDGTRSPPFSLLINPEVTCFTGLHRSVAFFAPWLLALYLCLAVLSTFQWPDHETVGLDVAFTAGFSVYLLCLKAVLALLAVFYGHTSRLLVPIATLVISALVLLYALIYQCAHGRTHGICASPQFTWARCLLWLGIAWASISDLVSSAVPFSATLYTIFVLAGLGSLLCICLIGMFFIWLVRARRAAAPLSRLARFLAALVEGLPRDSLSVAFTERRRQWGRFVAHASSTRQFSRALLDLEQAIPPALLDPIFVNSLATWRSSLGASHPLEDIFQAASSLAGALVATGALPTIPDPGQAAASAEPEAEAVVAARGCQTWLGDAPYNLLDQCGAWVGTLESLKGFAGSYAGYETPEEGVVLRVLPKPSALSAKRPNARGQDGRRRRGGATPVSSRPPPAEPVPLPNEGPLFIAIAFHPMSAAAGIETLLQMPPPPAGVCQPILRLQPVTFRPAEDRSVDDWATASELPGSEDGPRRLHVLVTLPNGERWHGGPSKPPQGARILPFTARDGTWRLTLPPAWNEVISIHFQVECHQGSIRAKPWCVVGLLAANLTLE
ncbi:hypothetical protein PAPYR_7877 [Paratrimastix pyriformis]|uniref:Uncharacterized protein n=1 Tax=Paratrimastix pyriformis TaxID=342808 RepID=A0ABQ8UD93_9EUKA|nr:hypothetical protein PAPYR_7877 [Paratrimastix pyriformis]